MCGLVAVFDEDMSAAEIKELTVELTRRIEHRGPDAVGFHGGDGWGLGHARLSIMDPASGAQPLVSSASGASVVHNGEIYNFKELRRELADERRAAGREEFAYTTGSDSETVLPLFEDSASADELASRLDGMFGIVAVSSDGEHIVAARDPCGIKPLYRGWSNGGKRLIIASELKCLVGQVAHAELIPPGHVWTREHGYSRYFKPEWLPAARDEEVPSKSGLAALPTGGTDRVRSILKAAVRKRLMSDVGYGLLLSGGLDSAIVATLMAELTDMSKIKSFTVGQPNSPDVMAARAVAEHVGTDHYEYLFTHQEAFSIVDRVVYHLETYEPELIRSAIPNYFLAKIAGSHVKVVLTGEGADELFAGYLYFRDAPDAAALHAETLRIWEHLASVNLQRADRMCMAHGLEARVPFLDVSMLEEAYAGVSPTEKMHGEGRMEKQALRDLFVGEIPHDVLMRTKAMQCEGVGTNWVDQLQTMCADAVSDADFADAANRFPLNTPQSKEEYYYRMLFEKHYGKGMDRFVHVWEGGCRAGGAPWQNSAYTRAGLVNTDQLKHNLMSDSSPAADELGEYAQTRKRLSALLVAGGDSRLDILPNGNNAYHCPPLPLPSQIVRGSCTGSPPTAEGVESATSTLNRLDELRAASGTDEAAYTDGFTEEMDEVRLRLAEALSLPEGTAAVLAASGTCAEYIPLAVANELYPGAPIRSVLAADGETGAGGVNACAGEYFNAKVPMQTATPGVESDAETPPNGTPLEGMGEVELLRIPARDEEGKPLDAIEALEQAKWSDSSEESSTQSPVWVLRQVVGCKTGFSTPRLHPPSDQNEDEARVIEVVDACQLRKPLALIHESLARGAIVLLTGSKFFQGSAFSAAVLLPPDMVKRLQQGASTAPPLPAGLGDFISRHEVPASLPHWREQLPSTPNEGLLLRWHTALPLVERVFAITPERRATLEAQWVDQVKAYLKPHATHIEVLHVELGIISIVLRAPDGHRCTKDELKVVHRHLATDASALPSAGSREGGAKHAARRCFIGQPVGITSEYAVLRLAMGAELLLEMDEGRYDPSNDQVVIDKLGWLIGAFDEIMQVEKEASRAAAPAPASTSRVSSVVASAVGGRRVVATTDVSDAAAVAGAALRGDTDEMRARHTLRTCDAVCFDVDSTVISEEGIDCLADYLGCGEAVAALTAAAMGGSKPFHEALAERLGVMEPSKAQLEALLASRHPSEVLTPRVHQLIDTLHEAGIDVYLVSGGFRQMINPLAEVVGVDKSRIYANRLLFDEATGEYAGFDANEPTSRAGGKAKVVAELKAANGYKSVVMIGDGATDMEARDVPGGADAFIGFGGVQVREKVKNGADWFVYDFGELIDEVRAK